MLEQQGAEPPVLTLIEYWRQFLYFDQCNLVVLDKVLWLAGDGGVGVHHILVHHGLGPEQGETPRTGDGWSVKNSIETGRKSCWRRFLRESYLQRTHPSMCSVAF